MPPLWGFLIVLKIYNSLISFDYFNNELALLKKMKTHNNRLEIKSCGKFINLISYG